MYPHGQSDWGSSDPSMDPPPPRIVLADLEKTRVCQAAADLEDARCADLTLLGEAGLIRMVERLRGSLDDVLQFISELQG